MTAHHRNIVRLRERPEIGPDERPEPPLSAYEKDSDRGEPWTGTEPEAAPQEGRGTKDFTRLDAYLDRHDLENGRGPTAFTWRDPADIPRRPWLSGHHLMRGQVSVTVAPGGVGKSSLTIVEALAMATGRRLLDDWNAGPLNVWLFNLEDPRDELTRRIVASAQHYGLSASDLEDRLFVDTGRERELCTATETRNGVQINRPEIETLAAEIKRFGIDVLIVDPFVSSHECAENDNSAMDKISKEWACLADRCNCAIELVHQTPKAEWRGV